MIDSQSVLYSPGVNDECFTPAYAVTPVLKYIRPGAIVWCPFDEPQSEFVKQLSATHHKVVYSHLRQGQDYYNYEPPHWDVMISNPPFTNKRKIFERALSFYKPFALLMNVVWLNDAAPKQIFSDRDLQLLMFEQRIQYNNQRKITFSSAYFCWNFLPKQIIMERLNIE